MLAFERAAERWAEQATAYRDCKRQRTRRQQALRLSVRPSRIVPSDVPMILISGVAPTSPLLLLLCGMSELRCYRFNLAQAPPTAQGHHQILSTANKRVAGRILAAWRQL